MNLEINMLLSSLLEELDNSSLIKEINELKKEIYNDSNLRKILEEYKKNNNIYDDRLISLKNEIISHSKIRRFRALQLELNILIGEINKRLNTLIEKKSCRV